MVLAKFVTISKIYWCFVNDCIEVCKLEVALHTRGLEEYVWEGISHILGQQTMVILVI